MKPLGPLVCYLCPADFATQEEFLAHVNNEHGGLQRYRNKMLFYASKEPWITRGQEWRNIMENAAEFQVRSSTEWEDFTGEMHRELRGPVGLGPRARWEARHLDACVFCALLYWSEELVQRFLAGPKCTMRSPLSVAALLSVDRYAERWPRIPREELDSSSVEIALGSAEANLPRPARKARVEEKKDAEFENTKARILKARLGAGSEAQLGATSGGPADAEPSVSTELSPVPEPRIAKLLLHKRRVSPEMIAGAQRAHVCRICAHYFWLEEPQMPPLALANDLWLGRLVPVLAGANYWHKQLLAQYRFVRSVVWLRSSGDAGDTRVNSWQKDFLQSGMRGTGIMFDNPGNVADEVRRLPADRLDADLAVCIWGGSQQDLDNTLRGAINPREYIAQLAYLQAHGEVFENVQQNSAGLRRMRESIAAGQTPQVLKDCITLVPDDEADEEAGKKESDEEQIPGLGTQTTAPGPGTSFGDEPVVASWHSGVQEYMAPEVDAGPHAPWAVAMEKFSNCKRLEAKVRLHEAQAALKQEDQTAGGERRREDAANRAAR